MDKAVEQLMEYAIEWSNQFVTGDDHAIPKEYESAVASFGATVIQIGPVPACALYLGSSKSKADKAKIVAVLIQLVIQQEQLDQNSTGHFRFEEEKKNNEILALIKEKVDNDKQLFKQRLFSAIKALKLAMRTFNLKEDTL